LLCTAASCWEIAKDIDVAEQVFRVLVKAEPGREDADAYATPSA
jgi:hypothetical protein